MFLAASFVRLCFIGPVLLGLCLASAVSGAPVCDPAANCLDMSGCPERARKLMFTGTKGTWAVSVPTTGQLRTHHVRTRLHAHPCFCGAVGISDYLFKVLKRRSGKSPFVWELYRLEEQCLSAFARFFPSMARTGPACEVLELSAEYMAILNVILPVVRIAGDSSPLPPSQFLACGPDGTIYFSPVKLCSIFYGAEATAPSRPMSSSRDKGAVVSCLGTGSKGQWDDVPEELWAEIMRFVAYSSYLSFVSLSCVSRHMVEVARAVATMHVLRKEATYWRFMRLYRFEALPLISWLLGDSNSGSEPDRSILDDWRFLGCAEGNRHACLVTCHLYAFAGDRNPALYVDKMAHSISRIYSDNRNAACVRDDAVHLVRSVHMFVRLVIEAGATRYNGKALVFLALFKSVLDHIAARLPNDPLLLLARELRALLATLEQHDRAHEDHTMIHEALKQFRAMLSISDDGVVRIAPGR